MYTLIQQKYLNKIVLYVVMKTFLALIKESRWVYVILVSVFGTVVVINESFTFVEYLLLYSELFMFSFCLFCFFMVVAWRGEIWMKE